MSDQDPGAGSTPDPGNGAGGTSAPSDDAKVRELEEKNAKLREELRQSQAATLGATHGLTKTEIELLAGQPRDKQEEIAKRLADEAKGVQPAATTTPPSPEGGPVPPPAGTAPAAGPALTPPDPEAAAAQAAFGSDGNQQPIVATTQGSLTERMNAELAKAESVEDMQAIQDKYKAEMREARIAERDAVK